MVELHRLNLRCGSTSLRSAAGHFAGLWMNQGVADLEQLTDMAQPAKFPRKSSTVLQSVKRMNLLQYAQTLKVVLVEGFAKQSRPFAVDKRLDRGTRPDNQNPSPENELLEPIRTRFVFGEGIRALPMALQDVHAPPVRDLRRNDGIPFGGYRFCLHLSRPTCYSTGNLLLADTAPLRPLNA